MRKEKKVSKKQVKKAGIETKKQEKKRLRKEGKNKHHRIPKSQGGTSGQGNLSIVRVPEHRAFHTVFGVKDPHAIVVQLNNVWLPLSHVAIVFKTEQITAALDLLVEHGLVEFRNIELHGITDDHLRYHGTETEQTALLPEPRKPKRPE